MNCSKRFFGRNVKTLYFDVVTSLSWKIMTLLTFFGMTTNSCERTASVRLYTMHVKSPSFYLILSASAVVTISRKSEVIESGLISGLYIKIMQICWNRNICLIIPASTVLLKNGITDLNNLQRVPSMQINAQSASLRSLVADDNVFCLISDTHGIFELGVVFRAVAFQLTFKFCNTK